MTKDLLQDLIYGEQIKTEGCEVNFVVGLTYSLNLDALLTVPLAIGEQGNIDSHIIKDRKLILSGIHKAIGKMAIFYNKGSIHVPKRHNVIYTLIEESIFGVINEECVFSNFHPKLWLVHETDKEGTEWMKLSVMSRNIDLSTSIDICCTMRGRISKQRSEIGAETHAPLKEMLLWLSENYVKNDKKRKEKVDNVAMLLDYVERFELDEPFRTEGGYAFFPFVYGKKKFAHYTQDIKFLLAGERTLVISPFIDTKTLEWLTERKKYLHNRVASTLITRKEYVTRKVFELFDEVYVPNDTMIDNTTTSVNLHAKMYLTQKTGIEPGYTLLLGSANATDNAFHRNAEFLLQLCYKQTTLDRIEELKNEIICDHRFIKLDAPYPEASDERELDDAEKDLKLALLYLKRAVVKKGEKDGLFDITLFTTGEGNKKIKIRPLPCMNYWKPLEENIKFTGLTPQMLSELYVLSLCHEEGENQLEMIAKVHTLGMPPDRNEHIYQNIVNNEEELLDIVAFMLSDTPAEFIFEHSQMHKNNACRKCSRQNFFTMPLYEQLLKKANSNPKLIDEVLDFIHKMKPEIVPDELKQMLETFKKVEKQLKK